VLLDLGVVRGDRVVVWSGANLDVVPVFAPWPSWGGLCPLNPLLSTDEYEHVRLARPVLLIADATVRRRQRIAQELGTLFADVLGGQAQWLMKRRAVHLALVRPSRRRDLA